MKKSRNLQESGRYKWSEIKADLKAAKWKNFTVYLISLALIFGLAGLLNIHN